MTWQRGRCPVHGNRYNFDGCGVCTYVVVNSEAYKRWASGEMEESNVGSQQS